MIEKLQLAITLMIIGMVMVFAILALVVQGGKVIILVVNRFFPEDEKKNVSTTGNDKQIAVLTAVVESITRGKGRIEKISKE
ncbi:MAG: hypothetical protein OEY51_11220 [Cyclobacteriaceae bacterium]|nr:hypothetical protein [Cyclobacteriaceae bacterium]